MTVVISSQAHLFNFQDIFSRPDFCDKRHVGEKNPPIQAID
jgi:hypothetical protein